MLAQPRFGKYFTNAPPSARPRPIIMKLPFGRRNVYIMGMDNSDSTNGRNYLISGMFIATGVLVGMLITMQFKSAIPATMFPVDELKAQKELIDSYVSDQGLLKTKITNLRNQIDEARGQSAELAKDNNLETLNSLKKDMGLELARGPGVLISLNDGMFVNRDSAEAISQSLIHASDLRDIVNILRTARAEAIAINDQRIIASTPITSVGNTILVNNFHLLPPFTVTAIGDSEVLLQRLNDPTSLPDMQKRAGEMKIQFEAVSVDGLMVPLYNGNLSTKFIRLNTSTET